MIKKLPLHKAPWGVRHYPIPEKQQYVIRVSTFEAGSWFILVFTFVWTAAFCLFAYSTIQDIVAGKDASEWGFDIIFFFSHGIPAIFLCWFSFKIIFERVTLTIDQQYLHHLQGIFGRGKEDLFHTSTILTIKLQEPYIIIVSKTQNLKIGESIPKKRQEFVVYALSTIVEQIKHNPSFLSSDLSQHLIE